MIYEIYKKELENDAKKPTDFKRDIETFCNKILGTPIKMFAKKKEGGYGKTVEHFCFTEQVATEIATENNEDLFSKQEIVTDDLDF